MMKPTYQIAMLCAACSMGCALVPCGETFERSVERSMRDRGRVVIHLSADGVIAIGGRAATIEEIRTLSSLPCFRDSSRVYLRWPTGVPKEHVQKVAEAVADAGIDDLIFWMYTATESGQPRR